MEIFTRFESTRKSYVYVSYYRNIHQVGLPGAVSKPSTTHWHFEKWIMNAFHINTITWKKLATIVSGSKKGKQPFIRQKICKHESHKIITFHGIFYSKWHRHALCNDCSNTKTVYDWRNIVRYTILKSSHLELIVTRLNNLK